MRKYILIKFFKGEATEQEIDSIIEWVNRSPENKRFFAEQKSLYNALDFAKLDKGDTIINGHKNLYAKWNKNIIIISAAAAVAILFFSIGFYANKIDTDRFSADRLQTLTSNNTMIHELHTERGVKGFLMLPDSTKVWLNADSKITYPDVFTGKTRDISLRGEAYFEVKKDSLHPMIVNTFKNFSLEVLGTSFNIKSYDNDDQIETTLYTGVIKARFKNKTNSQIETLTLKPNESFTYEIDLKSNSSSGKTFSYNKPERQKAWKDGSLIFDNTPMPDVIKMLERWHGTTFIVQNTKLFDYKLSAEFKSESIVQILEIMKLIMPMEYTYSNNVVTLK